MDVAQLAGEVTPYVTAAVGAYGTAVFTKAEDEAATASVNLGRRILQRLFRRGEDDSTARLESAIAELAEAMDDEGARDILAIRIRQLLATDDELVADVEEMMTEAGVTVTASGKRSIAAQTISGIAQTGDNASANQ